MIPIPPGPTALSDPRARPRAAEPACAPREEAKAHPEPIMTPCYRIFGLREELRVPDLPPAARPADAVPRLDDAMAATSTSPGKTPGWAPPGPQGDV